MRSRSGLAATLVVASLALAEGGVAQTVPPAHPQPLPRLLELDRDETTAAPLQDRLERELAAKQWSDAGGSAKEVVARLEERHGKDSIELVPALVNEATVALHRGAAREAIAASERALRLVEASRNLRDVRLAAPLDDLGLGLAASGHHAEAVEALEKAIFVRRTNLGLRSLEQLASYEALTRSLVALGRFDEAAARQRALANLSERASGRGSDRHLDALAGSGAWLARLGHFEEARVAEERRGQLLAEQGSPTDKRLVDPLVAGASTFVEELRPDFRGVLLLERALAIQESPPASPPAERADTLARLGDYYAIFRVPVTAESYYARAEHLLLTEKETKAFAALFGTPQLVRFARPGVADVEPTDLVVAEARVRFAVTARGQATDVEILDVKPAIAERSRARLVSSVERSFLRPRREAGRAVATPTAEETLRFFAARAGAEPRS